MAMNNATIKVISNKGEIFKYQRGTQYHALFNSPINTSALLLVCNIDNRVKMNNQIPVTQSPIVRNVNDFPQHVDKYLSKAIEVIVSIDIQLAPT